MDSRSFRIEGVSNNFASNTSPSRQWSTSEVIPLKSLGAVPPDIICSQAQGNKSGSCSTMCDTSIPAKKSEWLLWFVVCTRFLLSFIWNEWSTNIPAFPSQLVRRDKVFDHSIVQSLSFIHRYFKIRPPSLVWSCISYAAEIFFAALCDKKTPKMKANVGRMYHYWTE